jgi:hypothetical protein
MNSGSSLCLPSLASGWSVPWLLVTPSSTGSSMPTIDSTIVFRVLWPALLLVPVFALRGPGGQAPAEPCSHQDKPATKLEPFPEEAAKWEIRGRVRAAHPLKCVRWLVRGDLRARFPDGIVNPASQFDPTDLSLPHTLVVVDGLERVWSVSPPKEPQVEVVLKDSGFLPAMLAVRLGQQINVNSELVDPVVATFGRDDDDHGAIIQSIIPRDWPAQRGVLLGRELRNKPLPLLDRVGSFELAALEHDWMRCTVHVLPHRWFALTDSKGYFILPKLPNGKYDLRAVHDLLGEARQSVTISASRPKPVSFVFEVPERLRPDER